MISLLQSFAMHAQGQEHLKPLLPKQERAVSFRFGGESCTIRLSQQGITVSEGEESVEVVTVQQEEDLQKLLAGAVRMQPLLRRKGMVYTGTYRTLLLLESLFYVSQPLEQGA
ncbi:hypothetical protein [Ectobacillus ponti]|uniref:SCP2 domain-containing protein n=1 Tax=Ectobacillus ponti TaxID=2961894 RepID=A0AA41XA25_9BACI|nr:hypothetical protein [Ectobacillus ponti]MCP8969680.1 hypothetical protein [Ectobacillus ponti]